MDKIKRVIEWLKKNWKWVIFPIGICGLLITYLSRAHPPKYVYVDNSTDELVEEILTASEEKEEQLEALKEENKERMKQMTNAQKKELDGLKGKSIDEITAWFDKL